MVDAHHTLLDVGADAGDVLKCQRAVVELVVFDFVVDDVVDHTVDALLVVVFEALAGRFDGVDEHNDGRFAAEGSGPR